MDNFKSDHSTLKSLIKNANPGEIREVLRMGFITPISGRSKPFSRDYYLKLESNTIPNTHQHFYTGNQVQTGINSVTIRHPAHECCVTITIEEIKASLTGSSEDTEWFVVTNNTTDSGHVKGKQVLCADDKPWMPTNPTEQEGLTPDPAGIDAPVVIDKYSKVTTETKRFAKQAESIGKNFGKKLGLRKKS